MKNDLDIISKHRTILYGFAMLWIVFFHAPYNPFHLIKYPFVALCGNILDQIGFISKALSFLGTYSYEIYLLHFSFLVKYDFLLFRMPSWISILIYLICIIFLSVLLVKLFSLLRGVFINSTVGKFYLPIPSCPTANEKK